MVQSVKRRQASVLRVQQLLTAINTIRQQKQISNVERLGRYMEREHNIKKSETEKHLHYAVLDGLILSYTGIGAKGSKVGQEYEGFRIPDADEMNLDDDGHDWYCFECHGPGEMYACSECWRVFHPECQDEDTSELKYMCAICKSARKKKKTKRKLLNTLLSYTILRLKEKTRELHRIGHREEEKKYMPIFVYKPMDLNKMEQKVMAHKYKSIEEFLADAHNIYHNTVLIYGAEEEGGMTELAKIMIRDCKYDIDEMNQCQNCYYMSNAKPRNWFAQPCDPPHEVVYAKLKGFSYWPSKVIRHVGPDKLDVRFFGGLHQRAVIPKDAIKPIDTPKKKLAAKKTGGFAKAEEELSIHLKLLKERQEREEEEEEEEEDQTMEEEVTTEERGSSDEKEAKAAVKKAREEGLSTDNTETVSSSSTAHRKRSKSRKVSSPEDTNIVTSSEEYQPPAKVPRISTTSTGSQTPKKFTSATTQNKYTQTDPPEEPTPAAKSTEDTDKTNQISDKTDKKEDTSHKGEIEKSSEPVKETTEPVKEKSEPVKEKSEPVKDENKDLEKSLEEVEAKYEKMLTECEERLAKEYKAKQQKALDELSERLQKDFEDDKHQAVTRAMDKLQPELEKVRRQTEDKCREQYKDEMKKLAQKHKETISLTKKKQWCYNCEEEAMYHCCWNTSYCSVKCQQEHWHKEHKRVCRRKR